MGQYGRPPLATAGILVSFYFEFWQIVVAGCGWRVGHVSGGGDGTFRWQPAGPSSQNDFRVASTSST